VSKSKKKIMVTHSHPSGSANPSITDLHNFFGLVSLIVQSPYEEDDIFAWDSNGNQLSMTVID
ncbi:MAG: Mov34/MPN/PAD-1 family protein, partial [Thermoproteota archaeon]